MTDALVLVDIQRDYFPGGGHPLVEPEAAARVAARVLHVWRADRRPVVHIRHVWDSPEATFMRPGTPGIEFDPLVSPADDERVISKTRPNSFLGTPLLDDLRAVGADHITVVGMMSNMCIDATVRAGSDLGLQVTVVHDGCAASDLHFAGSTIGGATVHAAFMAALQGSYARVVGSEELLGS